FEVRGTGSPIEAWKSLTQWYTPKIGIDNSTALISRDENTQFPLVNYARLPSNPPAFLLNQILRPSFFYHRAWDPDEQPNAGTSRVLSTRLNNLNPASSATAKLLHSAVASKPLDPCPVRVGAS